MTVEEIAGNVLPVIKVNAYVCRNEGEQPLHWHGAECISDEDGHPALLVVFREPVLRDQMHAELQSTINECLRDFLGHVIRGPQAPQ